MVQKLASESIVAQSPLEDVTNLTHEALSLEAEGILPESLDRVSPLVAVAARHVLESRRKLIARNK